MGLWSRVKRLFGSTPPEEYAPPAVSVPSSRRRVMLPEERAPAKKRRVTRIRRDVLDLICAMGRDAFPNEFGASLRAEGNTITEVILVPGTLGGDRHAILPLHALPVDTSIVGTVHSHPSPNAEPSDADLQLFRHFGHTHIIVGAPYDRHSWIAYDHDGDEIDLEIVP